MKIIYDISMSRRYSGTPHGLIRVEVAIAKELSKSDSDVVPIWLENYESIQVGNSIDLITLVDGALSDQPAFSNYGTQ